ncbi:glycerophosphoryl diester phosphodiesterase membrane domain-containing protein [Acidobacteriota bacterium]
MWNQAIQYFYAAWIELFRNLRSLVLFDLFFKLLTIVVLVPATTWTLMTLISATGRPSLSNEEILEFLFSPIGITWLLLAGSFSAAILFAEHGGMMLIGRCRQQGRILTSSQALLLITRRLLKILILAGLLCGAHLLLLIPFAAAGAGIYAIFLSTYDLNYLYTQTPWEWWVSLGPAGTLFLIALVVHGFFNCDGLSPYPSF